MNDKGRSEMLGMRIARVALMMAGGVAGVVSGWHLPIDWRIIAGLVGAVVALGLFDIVRSSTAKYTEPMAGLPLWRDRDGDIWRGNADGTLTLAWIRDGSGRAHVAVEVHAPALTREEVDGSCGPLVRLAQYDVRTGREIRPKGDHR